MRNGDSNEGVLIENKENKRLQFVMNPMPRTAAETRFVQRRKTVDSEKWNDTDAATKASGC